jgi:hypothetical protein
MNNVMKILKWYFLAVDVAFILYWLMTVLHLIPHEWLFKDYDHPILIAWNWSFLPLDLLISATGLISLRQYGQNRPSWRSTALVSLVLTFCSGLQALAFWAIRFDFDPLWWLSNAFLLIYPFFLSRNCLCQRRKGKNHGRALFKEILYLNSAYKTALYDRTGFSFSRYGDPGAW